jgi:dolichyl-phosphate-mannose-protein mannosyltransferase
MLNVQSARRPSTTHARFLLVLGLVAVGALVRIWFLWLPNNDDDLFLQDWAQRLLNHGIANIYDPAFGRVSAMHPPLNYFLLYASAAMYRAFFIPSLDMFDQSSVALMVLVKLPNLVADLLIGWCIFISVRRRVDFARAVCVLCLYLFNPAMIWEAGFVGQIEAIQTLPILLAVLMLVEHKVELAWAAMTLGALAKPQGVVVVPLVVGYTILRSSAGQLIRAIVLAGAVALVVLSPWIVAGKIGDVAQVYAHTIDTYPFLTLNAANAWGLGTALSHPGFSIGSGDGSDTLFISDSTRVNWLFGMTYKQAGLLMLAASYSFALWCTYRRRDRMALPLTASFVFFAFFMLPTQVAERYLFPFIPLLATMLTESATIVRVYAVASATFMLNLYLVFPLPAVLPWNVVSNQKEPLPHHYLHFPVEYRALLTLILCIVNTILFLAFIPIVRAGMARPQSKPSGEATPAK